MPCAESIGRSFFARLPGLFVGNIIGGTRTTGPGSSSATAASHGRGGVHSKSLTAQSWPDAAATLLRRSAVAQRQVPKAMRSRGKVGG